ncbi:Predicted arabinose efflux permease, MFS family [Georgenia satyanarayanai]|uniref:Predicted arabinose efflux permease, MFS family n=1 Tax=Georgenia satyanarayanai TaxID=860221 RepID=A0A2Y9ASC0_9MICO|nr:MFS transporter [Georgenia satyanarayanai]PYF98304.1 putative MFS family arabinose efflux permease [Georgenia satyanarayanai]SSA45189.1 Predicted arabinose efflux permease, MFS family [Georgenia satyanarayanai]
MPQDHHTHRRAVALLALSNVLGGIGVASGIAVGALLAEQLGGTAVAGLAQAAGVLGAAVAAVPLAALATRRGRRWSLTLGYTIALLGAGLVVTAAVVGSFLLLLLGLGTFGVAQAANLQSRYAAADGASAATRARSISVVMWATTIGSVAGPNLTAAGERVASGVGIPGLAGPYLFSALAFALAATVLGTFFRPADDGADGSVRQPVLVPGAASPPRTVGATGALRWAAGHSVARFAVGLIALAHAVMVMVMVMTPVHMRHSGMSLELVGIVISVHVLGMYALSPVFGWLVDRSGGVRVAVGGIAVLFTATVLGFVAAASGGRPVLTAAALTVLGLGWSASLIAASALLTEVAPDPVRVPLQGATDAVMSYAGAAAAALAGPVLAAGGFRAVNVAAALLVLPAALLAVGAARPAHVTTPADGR